MELAKIVNGNLEVVFCDPNQFDSTVEIAFNDYKSAEELLADFNKKIDIKEYDKTVEELTKNVFLKKAFYERFAKMRENNALRFLKLKSEGFMPLTPAEKPTVIDSSKKAVDSYEVMDGRLVQMWIIVDDEQQLIKQIDEAKIKLETSDYKVLKCYEANMSGKQPPYDLDVLLKERQSYRDQINMLETKIKDIYRG